jgi:hypothetical protein
VIQNLLLSQAFALLFVVVGLPFSYLILKPENQKTVDAVQRISVACALGVAIPLVTCSTIMSLGGWWTFCICVNLTIWIASIVVLIRTNRFDGQVSVLKNATRMDSKAFGLLLVLVACSAILISASKPNDAILGVRIGVDSALYADGAQMLLENNGARGFEAISAATTTIFGPAAFLSHLRWGVPVILATVTKLFALDHSYLSVIPLLALLHGLSGLIAVSLCKRLLLPTHIAIFGGIAVATNYVFINLAIEGQWAQSMSIPFFLLFVCLESEKSKRFDASLLGASLMLVAGTLFYGEMTPIFLFIYFLILAKKLWLNSMRISTYQVTRSLALILLAGVMIFPYIKKYIEHLGGLSLAVGFGLPHWMNGSELLGIGSIWTNGWETTDVPSGMTARRMEFWDFARSQTSYILLLFGMFTILRKRIDSYLWFGFFTVFVVLWLRFNQFGSSEYLWMKVLSSSAVFCVVVVIFAIYRSRLIVSTLFSNCLLFLLGFSVLFTTYQQLENYRSVSRPISSDILEVRSFLEESEPCVIQVVLSPENADLSWPRDRVFLYLITPIFRGNVLVNVSQTIKIGDGDEDGINFAGELTEVPQRICLLIEKPLKERLGTNVGIPANVVFENKHWKVEISDEIFKI